MYRACEVYAMDKRTKVSALCTQRRWQLYTDITNLDGAMALTSMARLLSVSRVYPKVDFERAECLTAGG
jgi:hypothetical protein